MTSEFKSILKKDFSINDKYKVILFLKKGINAENYRVEGTDGKLYFLKLFDYSKISSTSFNENKELTEIEIAKQLNHPNIVKYVDSGEVIISQKKYAFLVLDYIPGETLHEKIKREPLTNYYDIKLIAEGLLNGLVYLHSQESPIIHNEITPHNIMLDLSSGEPQVKIIDFGYARFFNSPSKSYNKENIDFNYVAPECINNIFSPQSDVFSVGVILYQLLFGILPWTSELSKFQANSINEEKLLYELRKKPLLFPNLNESDVVIQSNTLDIISKALNFKTEKRFKNAATLLLSIQDNIIIEEELNEDEVLDLEDQIENKSQKQHGGFSLIAGMDSLKARLKSDVIDVLENPEEYKKHNLGLPNGMLLYGPPGCGKTFFAERFAEEAGYNFKKVISSDIASIYVHGAQEKIGNIFKDARENAPTILYFDELDAMVPNREKLNNQSQSGEVNEFLSQLDNIGDSGVFVIGSTNKPDSIDRAILRAGRLEKWFYISPPDFEARKSMFELYLKNRPLDFGINYSKLAELTENYVSSDIKLLIDEASRKTIREKTKRISMETLEFIIKNQKPTVPASELRKYEEIRRKLEDDDDGQDQPYTRPKIGF
jgi:transitional endoplasmic reticulum ATPase